MENPGVIVRVFLCNYTTFDALIHKFYTVKKILFIISFAISCFLPAAHCQTYYPKPARGLPIYHIVAKQLPAPTNQGIDTSNTFIDYYKADSALYAPHFMSLQGQLINNYYSFPKDTTKSYLATSAFFMNYDCINSISVAFNSIPGGNIDTLSPGQAQIRAIYIPIIQVNHSGKHDTLQIAITTVNAHGYPQTNTYLQDTLIIDSNNTNNIGAGNDYTIHTIVWNLANYPLPANTFAVTVNYFDPSKQDSCWFLYGYGYFNKTCPYEPSDDTIFAANTHFSTITTNTKPFVANSIALWNEYAGLGYLPSIDGNNIFYPCTAADSNSYQPGIDGANYLQDIDIAADMVFISYLGIPGINFTGISVKQNYPNPFNNSTTINYSITKPGDVSLKITDITGREVFSQEYGKINQGEHTIQLNATMLRPGIYFYSITSSGFTITKKMAEY